MLCALKSQTPCAALKIDAVFFDVPLPREAARIRARLGGGIMRKEYRSSLTTFAAVAGLVFAVTSSAIAWGLSDEDYDYLRTTHNLERYESPGPRSQPEGTDANTRFDHRFSNGPRSRRAGTRMSKTLSPCFLATSYGKKRIPAKCGTSQGLRFQIDLSGPSDSDLPRAGKRTKDKPAVRLRQSADTV